MTGVATFMDWGQVVFAIVVLLDTYHKILAMTRRYNNLKPFEKQILASREQIHYSPKMFLVARSFVVLFFLIIQIDWALTSSSANLSSSEDVLWFIMGVLICLNWWKGNDAQMAFFKLLTQFRESEPPCGLEKCPTEDLDFKGNRESFFAR